MGPRVIQGSHYADSIYIPVVDVPYGHENLSMAVLDGHGSSRERIYPLAPHTGIVQIFQHPLLKCMVRNVTSTVQQAAACRAVRLRVCMLVCMLCHVVHNGRGCLIQSSLGMLLRVCLHVRCCLKAVLTVRVTRDNLCLLRSVLV